MARITAYGVMNILFAAMVAFFWPCYSIYIFSDECGGFLSDAGRLVQYMWYPGTVDLCNYGARGPGRYNGGDEKSGVLRGACVPCPSQLLDIIAVEYGPRHNYVGSKSHFGPLEAPSPFTQELDVSRAQCVRVGDVGLAKDGEYLLRGPRSTTARDYLLYQLFGPQYHETFNSLYGPGIYEGTGSRTPNRLSESFRAKFADRYNKQLFRAGSPFPFLRDKLDTTRKDVDHPFLVSGYYLVNGRPLLLPKLWDYIYVKHPIDGTEAFIISSNGALWTTVPENYKAQYETSEHMAGQVYISQGHAQALHGLTSNDPAGNTRNMELEWWYPELCGNKSKCGDNWYQKTSLQYWTEEHYEDYVQRFFAGGGDVTALWSGAMQNVLPNVTVNTNAVAQRRRK